MLRYVTQVERGVGDFLLRFAETHVAAGIGKSESAVGVESLEEGESGVANLGLKHGGRVVLGMRGNLFEHAGVVNRVVRKCVAVDSELLTFGFSLLPRPYARGYEERGVSSILLDDGRHNVA